jgi:dihydroorotase
VVSLDRLTIPRPDDWHLHLRDGAALESVVGHSASTFRRALVMPNLRPPVRTVAEALDYRDRILAAVPGGEVFAPLMTLYLTPETTVDEIARAAEAPHVAAVKLYPAGATTNAEAGVRDLGRLQPVLEAMAEHQLPLCVHGESTDPEVDVFDREAAFIDRTLGPLCRRLPELRVVFEHITTAEAVEFVRDAPSTVAATVTPQHLWLNRNALFEGGVRPHRYCLPVLKREYHREALVDAVTSGDAKFFLGTDSAPHSRASKESSCGCAGMFNATVAMSIYAEVFERADALDRLEAFCSRNGPAFYGHSPNEDHIALVREPWEVPASYPFEDTEVVPMAAGQTLQWRVADA